MNTDSYCSCFRTFKIDKVIDKFFSKYAAFSQELIVRFQSIQCLIKRTWNTADSCFFCVRQFVNVFVEWSVAFFSRIDFTFDSVQTSHQHCRECKVWVCCGVRSTELNTTALRSNRSYWNTYSCRTITFGVYKVYWSFITRNQTFERVCTRVSESDQSWCMVQDTTDIVQCCFTQISISAFFVEQWSISVKDGLVNVHPATVVAKQWLRHKGCRFSILKSCVMNDVFVHHQVISSFKQSIETEVNFCLACCCHFMVVTFNANAYFFKQAAHFTTHVLLFISWSYWNVATFYRDFISKVAAFFRTTCVPNCFL
ncbi:hypothetical protein D3C81_1041200 [compost metagenome]